MAKYQAEAKYIASIFPGKLEAIKRHVGPSPELNSSVGFCTMYFIPPWPKGGTFRRHEYERLCKQYSGTDKKPSAANLSMPGKAWVLEVSDAFEKYLDSNESQQMGHHVYNTKLVPCEDLVSDILRHWAGQMVDVPTGVSPGIIEIANTCPTGEELERMYAMQKGYFEYLFSEGERLAGENKRKEISPNMQLAADWLGPDYERVWSHPSIAGRSTPCPVCQKSMPINAFVCGTCGYVVKALPPELAALNAAKVPTQPAA